MTDEVAAHRATFTRHDEIARSLRENRNDYAERLQSEMRAFISDEIGQLRVALVKSLPVLIRRECLKVLKKALAPEKKRKAR